MNAVSTIAASALAFAVAWAGPWVGSAWADDTPTDPTPTVTDPCSAELLAVPGSYRVGAGDVVQVQVYGEADLSGTFPIDSAEAVVIPLVGTVPVGGLTADCIAVRITTALADGYLRDPDVTVSLDGFRSQPVSVLGAVKQPGLYYLDGPTTVLQMLSKAGGVTNDGIDAVRLTRSSAQDDVLVIAYEPLVSEGRDNLTLSSGDVLFVPDLSVTVLGSVKDPGDIPYREGLTVSRSIAAAGGATDVANVGRVFLMRGDERVRVNVRRVLKGKDPDVVLQPGDQVFVKESSF